MSQQRNKNQLPLTASNIPRIEKYLVTILDSPHFKSAKKMQKLLSYVVHKTLEGDGDKVKQYSIAVDALGHPDDFDGDSNPAIRIMVGRVRERLEKYYKEEGINDRIVLHLDKGHYTPWFEEREQEIKPSTTSTDHSQSNKNKSLWRNAIIATLVIAGLAILFNQFVNNKPDKQYASFNAPLVDVMPFDDLSVTPRHTPITERMI